MYYGNLFFQSMGYRPDYYRYVYLYCYSAAQEKRYDQLAEAEKTSLNKFLINKIEEALNLGWPLILALLLLDSQYVRPDETVLGRYREAMVYRCLTWKNRQRFYQF